jgi:hypothetical protein
MWNGVKRLGNIQGHKVNGTSGAIGTVELASQYIAHMLGTAHLAEAKRIIAKDFLRPVHEPQSKNSFTNTECGIGQIYRSPVGRV